VTRLRGDGRLELGREWTRRGGGMVVVHPEPYTIDEYFELPDDGMRYEL
jgi:hypothetical protein